MTDVNGITGARLVSKPSSKEYENGWDKIVWSDKVTLKPNDRPAQTWEKPEPTCSKCGMKLGQVMGYVCPNPDCPTFPKVTC